MSSQKVVIIGAGVFGLSTALALARRWPDCNITIVDRSSPPVKDGTSVDTTRCIRSDYVDPIYRRLATIAQDKILSDPELQPWTFQQGMTFVCDGRPSRFTSVWKDELETHRGETDFVEATTREQVFQRIHGSDSTVVALDKPYWNVAYTNLAAAFIDAEEGIRVYVNRCQRTPSITFRCGSAVNQIDVVDGTAHGIVLQDGTHIAADLVVVAAGAWSNKLVHLGTRVHPIGHEVAWIKVTPEEEAKWRNMSITTNMSTGLNMFPPYRGEIKILRRSPGFINTTTIPNPEDPSSTIRISYPRTIADHPTDVIPLEAETAMRDNLREIMPSLADRPFDRSKICWISTTPTADFLIAPHPRFDGVHLATGGSAHAWKFLPIIGDLVVDSIEGVLDPELCEKWKFDVTSKGKDSNAPRMDGEPKELSQVVRQRL